MTEKLQNVFKKLRGKGRLTEEDVKIALKEVKMALLEADVNFRVVKQFTKAVQERAVGQDVMNGLNPGQMVIKIVNEELVNLMGSETTELPIKPGNDITVLMMAGLQGAGKTTTIKSCCGILNFDEGEIYVDGVSVKEKPLECKRKIAYIPDNPDLYEFMTGIKYLNFIADIFGISQSDRQARISKYAEMFEIKKCTCSDN